MLQNLTNMIVNFADSMGYTGIFIMMTIESSFIPFPSEVAMIPAGFLASIGKMDFLLALIVGTAGALVGATINYYIAFKLGEKVLVRIIRKYGKYVFLTERHYMQAEDYFAKHGSITVFLARFIPAIRQLISLPAGAFEMNFAKFFFYTGLGAGIWNLILMTIGYIAGENKQLIKEYLNEVMIGGIAFIIITGAIYYYINKRKNEAGKSKK